MLLCNVSFQYYNVAMYLEYLFSVQSEIISDVINLVENESNLVTFSCQAIGEPLPTISWYFNDAMINSSDENEYNISTSLNGTVVTSILTVVNAQSTDVGTYTCITANIIGSDQSSGKLTVNGKLYFMWLFAYINNLIDAAEIIEPSGGKTEQTKEGNNTTLRCIGEGYPPPLVQWSKLNGSLSDRVSSSNMSMSTNEGNVTRVTVDLIFTGAYREDTGVYECSVSNLLSNVVRNITLIIQCMYAPE